MNQTTTIFIQLHMLSAKLQPFCLAHHVLIKIYSRSYELRYHLRRLLMFPYYLIIREHSFWHRKKVVLRVEYLGIDVLAPCVAGSSATMLMLQGCNPW